MTHSDAAERYAVMGNPISHSRSPAIHRMFADQFKDDIDYTAIQVGLDGFADAVRQFRASGGRGLNVTVPFKLEAFHLADTRTDQAEKAQAANTLRFSRDGRIEAHNTDGLGLVRDLARLLGIEWRDRAAGLFAGKSILILGAGGAVRGVLAPLLECAPAMVVIANRTIARAQELKQLAGTPLVRACGFDDLAGQRFDIVINGTSASLKGEVLPLPRGIFRAGALAYDMMYGNHPTPFMDWARQNHVVTVSDGLGMLVEQAAESYYFWRGKRPETAAVMAALRVGA
ncbi:MAG: shikimate dehydrogenase [Gammaproteobacteria bacterium]|nr:shikimate dehydrogenase [Gammaproteobacteria bacterium]